jgi:hypothetical protein
MKRPSFSSEATSVSGRSSSRSRVCRRRRGSWECNRSGPRNVLGDVVVDRNERQAALVPRVAVRHLGQIELHVESALGRGAELVLSRRHRDPLSNDTVTHDVLFDGSVVVRLAVSLQRVRRGSRRIPEAAKTPGPVVKIRGPRISLLPDEIGIGKDVIGRGLRIPCRGDAVREVREVLPHFGLMNPAGAHICECASTKPGISVFPETSMTVAPAGSSALTSHCLDAVSRHDHVATREHLVSLHRDDAAAPRRTTVPEGFGRGRSTSSSTTSGFRPARAQSLSEETAAQRPVHLGSIAGPAEIVPPRPKEASPETRVAPGVMVISRTSFPLEGRRRGSACSGRFTKARRPSGRRSHRRPAAPGRPGPRPRS